MNDHALGADDFVPRLEAARAAGLTLAARVWWRLGLEVDLMEREPIEARRLAAIIVSGRVLRRRRLAYRREVPASEAARAPEAIPPPVVDLGVESQQTVITDALSGVRRCTQCLNGRVSCVVCLGRGYVEVARSSYEVGALRACSACGRGGTQECPHCAGTAETVEVRCVDLIDEVVHLAYPYVPTMSFALEEKVRGALEQELDVERPVPDCLFVDLEPQRAGGPYRATKRDPEFRGFSYADALAKARAALAGTRGEEPIAEELTIHARPILWLRYAAWGTRREVALFYDLEGNLRAMVADGGL
jgi:hypothetical protein